VAIVGTAAVAVAAVVDLHSLDMLVADTQEQGEPAGTDVAEGPEDTAGIVVHHALVVAQPEIVVPCPLDDPVHIASHSNSGIPALADLASVVVVLRFPLYLLYPTRLMRFVLLFCSCPVPLLWREA